MTTAPNSEQLLADLRQLVRDAEKLLRATVPENAEQAEAMVRDRLRQAQAKLSDYYEDARDKITSGARRSNETIRSHPYESLAIALSVGVILGALIRRA